MSLPFLLFGWSILNSPLPEGEGLGVREYSLPGIRFDLCP